MRSGIVVMWMMVCSIAPAAAQVGVAIGVPGVSIGIDVPVYPQLVPVPGYPVYYAPGLNSNYFFYDGMYWIYQRDNWYASSWYNGPWTLVGPDVVPLFVLRVPVQYYRRPPVYFRGWRWDAPPRWGTYWGNAWAQQHRGWDNWNHTAVPASAPLPVYQRQYSGDRYPRSEQQQAIQVQNYRYQPHDAVVQQHYRAQPQGAPAASPQLTQTAPRDRSSPAPGQRATIPPNTPPQAILPAPHGQPPQMGTVEGTRPGAGKTPAQQGVPMTLQSTPQPQQGAVQRQQQAGKVPGQDNSAQGRMKVQESKPRHPPQQAQELAVPREQQAPRGQVKAPAQEARQSQEKGREKGEPKGGEPNR